MWIGSWYIVIHTAYSAASGTHRMHRPEQLPSAHTLFCFGHPQPKHFKKIVHWSSYSPPWEETQEFITLLSNRKSPQEMAHAFLSHIAFLCHSNRIAVIQSNQTVQSAVVKLKGLGLLNQFLCYDFGSDNEIRTPILIKWTYQILTQ